MDESSAENATSSKKFRVLINDLPEALCAEINEKCWRHAVGFVIPKKPRPEVDESVKQAGSGTLLRYKNRLMILTAAHVMTELRRAGRFGVIQHRRMRMEALLPCEDYHFLPLADEPYSYDGPDLGLIVIPPALGHLYEAGIVAVNMDEQLARFQSLDDFASDEGLSAFAGFLDEYTRITPEPDGLGDMAGFSLFAAIGVARSKQRIERHEYFEIEAYRHEVYGPNTWGGMSGSGVWNFPLTTAPDGSLTHKPPLLCGVVFQEGPRQEDHRVVKCHGPSSIYQEALQRT